MLHVLAAFAPHVLLARRRPERVPEGDAVQVKVNKLSSAVTQLPFDYYRLPHCRPAELVNMVENLGRGASRLDDPELGVRAADGQIGLQGAVQEGPSRSARRCSLRCASVKTTAYMIMDNLPAATRMISELPDGKTVTMYDRGYRLGFVGAKEFPGTKLKQPYINNHLRFIVKYHKEPATFTGARIVGFEVEAFSVKHTYKGTWGTKDAKLTSVPLSPDLPPQPISEAGEYIFTYDVSWRSQTSSGRRVGTCTRTWATTRSTGSRSSTLGDRAAADRHRRDDHDAHAAPRPQPVQPGGEGGAPGGVRLEARPR